METELFIVCALPYSARPDSGYNVSLFVAPKLTPSQPGEKLNRFRVFSDWGRLAHKRLQIELFDQSGLIECEPLLDAIEPGLWKKLFGPQTPVVGSAVPQWQDRHWRTFDTRNVQLLAKLLHLATIYTNPTSPPVPHTHPLAQPLERILAAAEWTLSGTRLRGVYDESVMTAALDELVEKTPLERWVGLTASFLDTGADPLTSFIGQMAVELHRARRFYERPESQGKYRDRPDPDAKADPLPAHEPEFHERCAMAGDHPALLRKLGLVIDLRADVVRLLKSQWLTARIAVSGDASLCRTTRVRCQSATDGSLVTVPEADDWYQGALRLGEEDRFVVLDVDADGSAIKAERFLWTLPRLLKIERNGDPVNAATPAMRATGFTVARTGQALESKQRLSRQTALEANLQTGAESTLHAEDVTRGMRIEVWDDIARRWASLHSRQTDIAVTGHGVVLEDLAEEGFIQGAAAHETPGVANSPIHLHEAMFGWEGWSLSAPRPGKRIRHKDGKEVVEETPTAALSSEKPPHPIQITNRARPGSLPRLRFGRSYAFRAWAVDLAGNSRPHALNPATLSPGGELASAASMLAETPVSRAEKGAAAMWAHAFRKATHEAIEARRLELPVQRAAEELPGGLASLVAPRLRERRGADLPQVTRLEEQVHRRALVNEAAAAAVRNVSKPFLTDIAVRSPSLLASHLSTELAGAASFGASPAELAAAAAATVTKLYPFLRWDPVQPPAVVPRRRYTEGESLRVLVVRSGVTQDPATLDITITDPETYADAVESAHPTLDLGYFGESSRHLAPPKTSQIQAELHGMFDAGIGSVTVADHQKMLGWALREDGSFHDLDRADTDDPPGRLPQPGVRLEHQSATPQVNLKTLPLDVGEPPAPGQYVVHDVDDLALPYLPDPMARGIALVFPEAGQGRSIPLPFGGEGFTAAYEGTWPEIEPFRLVLDGASALGGNVSGRVLTLHLPPGDRQIFRLSSSLDKSTLELFGVWRSLTPDVQGNADVAEAAADGWVWGLTPSEDVQLVHAVPRPLEAPRPTMIIPDRNRDETAVALAGAVDVHGPSTDSLIAQASWSERVDDLTLDVWQERTSDGIAFQTTVLAEEDLAILGRADQTVNLPGFGSLQVHAALHLFGDTRHRMVSYTFRATTRFREYFHPELLKPAFPTDDGGSVVGPETVVDVPSSAPPAPPVVHSVIPLFRWDFGTEAEQPMARRHTRRAGVRIYLERPWYSSGDGELLGVLLAPAGNDDFEPRPKDESGYPFVSKVGADPIWKSTPVEHRALQFLALDNLLHAFGADNRKQPGRPAATPVFLPLESAPGKPTVLVVGYEPQFNATRGLWYVDVAIDPGKTFWPFVRLAVCRYQPSSVAGCHLSAPVRCDFVQLPPERTTSVNRTDDRHVRVVVSGTVGVRGALQATGAGQSVLDQIGINRTVVARLQKRDPLIDTDLGWQTVATKELIIRGMGANESEVAWVGELDAGQVVPLRRPATASESGWRVTVEEWEQLPGDPPAPYEIGPVIAVFPRWEQRLVYADEVLL
jgi:hypothetical protein